jgi:hypothetical protein
LRMDYSYRLLVKRIDGFRNREFDGKAIFYVFCQAAWSMNFRHICLHKNRSALFAWTLRSSPYTAGDTYKCNNRYLVILSRHRMKQINEYPMHQANAPSYPPPQGKLCHAIRSEHRNRQPEYSHPSRILGRLCNDSVEDEEDKRKA